MQSYLALTDVLIGIIKCSPTCIAGNAAEKEALKRVLNKMSSQSFIGPFM